MPIYLEIAVNVPRVSGVFHYHLPPEWGAAPALGSLVSVPFGAQTVQGVILRQVAQPSVSETRPLLDLLDPEPVLTSHQMRLADWLSESTLAPLAACINLFVPSGLSQQADTLLSLPPGFAGLSPGATPAQQRLVNLLQQRGPLRGRQVDQVLKRQNWRSVAQSLARRGLLLQRPVLQPPSVQSKTARTVQLACAPHIAQEALPELGRAGTAALARRQAMLRYLLREPGPLAVAWLYAESGGTLADLRYLAERGLVAFGETEVWRDPLAELEFQPSVPPRLTGDQETAWSEIRRQLLAAAHGDPTPPLLLHGVTGSGKTELYLQAVQQTLALGRQAVILVPEIALTPQTVRRFASRFPGRTGLIHSRLSAGERFDTWRRARSGELDVIVGPRSALFMPLANPGLFILDECHDDSYYQSEGLPHYHALPAAEAYARLAGAVCLLGSATPDVATTYGALQASPPRYKYLHLPARILAHQEAVRLQMQRLEQGGQHQPGRYRPLEAQASYQELPPVRVVDMRQELQRGNRSIFSLALQQALAEVLAGGQQAILFLNRRGTATYVFCRDCGYVVRCPHCDLPLTYHTQETRPELRCHYCGYTRKSPPKCPECGGPHIRHYGAGTEKVEAEVQSMFPSARLLRWDYETTRTKDAHDVILGHFSAGRADILIGTQMIAKGLDLPRVTLVGAVLADVGLSLPDYRAAERTFQVLTQVAGRAGRSPLGGQVILQTFQPDHYVIQAAAGHDYQAFYTRELAYRRQLGYPPYASLLRLEYRHADAARAEAAARQLAAQLQLWLRQESRRATQIVGPAPCFFSRQSGDFRWQIVLRGPDPASLLQGRNLDDWRIEVNPPSLL